MHGGFSGVVACAAALLLAAQPANAQSTGALTSKIELEKTAPAAKGGKPVKTYVDPAVVVPGDRVRVTLIFTNNGTVPVSGVHIDNPIPKGLVFDGTDDTAAFSISVDGAKAFGLLDTLTMPVQGGAPRAAVNADVTHVRWLWSDPIAPGQSRSVAFFGRVK